MKSIIKAFGLLAILTLCISVISCGSDDEDNSPIVGTWVDGGTQTYKFNSDGNGSYSLYYNSMFNSSSTFKWSMKNGYLLTLRYSEGSDMNVDSQSFIIVFNEDFTEMDMIYSDDGEHHGTFYKQ